MKLNSIGAKNHRGQRTNSAANPFKFDFGWRQSLNIKKKIAIYRELNILVSSGIEVSKAIGLIKNQETKSFYRKIFEHIENSLVKGRSLANAMEEANVFSTYEIFSVKAGEETRSLEQVFATLEKFFNRQLEFKRKIVSLLSYPLFVILITLGVLYFMLTYVVPMFSGVFRQFGNELPEITRIVIKFSNIFDTILYVIIGFAVAIFFIHKYLVRYEYYQSAMNKVLFAVPFFGKLIKNLHLLKFFELMALLLNAKVPLPVSLKMALSAVESFLLQENIKEVLSGVESGFSVSEKCNPLLFNSKMITLIKIGEEVNELSKVFENLAEQLDKEIDHQITMFGKVMEPVILLVIASIVGFILIAMYYPMFKLSQVINY